MLHAMIDLYHCNPTLLHDEAFLLRVLEDYPDFILSPAKNFLWSRLCISLKRASKLRMLRCMRLNVLCALHASHHVKRCNL